MSTRTRALSPGTIPDLRRPVPLRMWNPETRTLPGARVFGVLLAVVMFLGTLAPGAHAAPAPDDWFTPVPGFTVVRPFDKPDRNWESGHRGIDVGALPGEEVRAPQAGTVRFSGSVAGRPVLSLEIEGHVVSFEPVESELRAGDPVFAGQPVGTVADPSHCEDGCIHVGVWQTGREKDYLNPASFFAADATILLPEAQAPEELPAVPAGDDGSSGAGRWGGHENGRIPAVAMCPLAVAPGHRLRCDAARAFDALASAYADEFGRPVSVTDSYRDYETQVVLKRRKGRMAATPGTSNHGWGLAVDLGGGINSFGTVQHEWMRSNGPRFGWIHPSWARSGGSLPEPWHWEFRAG
ncbi:D-alanyl-D-alanine carboxypeptidase family protein [Brevibacterium ihuae]|uniref:D-alanyl-D-alanine carboxypeptidase family protein n=1 Tax=Brevibacterium ihuae TaxID=1631743 RepID=UPI001FE4B89B|nr:D-alanyl-D-alanine carboxypeptidase family protein [Brevibacterium ihuae]